jgi:DNA polymerase-4
MDAFFVNVHLLDHPKERGLPLAVGGDPAGRGVIASASYEARQFGVRSAMPSARALRLCPRLKIVGHTWPRIRECSRQVMALLAEFGPVEQMSVDEAYVDLSDRPDPESFALAFASGSRMKPGCLPPSAWLPANWWPRWPRTMKSRKGARLSPQEWKPLFWRHCRCG